MAAQQSWQCVCLRIRGSVVQTWACDKKMDAYIFSVWVGSLGCRILMYIYILIIMDHLGLYNLASSESMEAPQWEKPKHRLHVAILISSFNKCIFSYQIVIAIAKHRIGIKLLLLLSRILKMKIFLEELFFFKYSEKKSY